VVEEAVDGLDQRNCERTAIIIYVPMTEINQPEKLKEHWQWKLFSSALDFFAVNPMTPRRIGRLPLGDAHSTMTPSRTMPAPLRRRCQTLEMPAPAD
jgi:hypothetical protein